MGKSEVYSWRLSPAAKAALQLEARRQGSSVAALLDHIARDWLERQRLADEAEQARLHAAAKRTFGTIAADHRGRSERVRELVRERLRRRYDR